MSVRGHKTVILTVRVTPDVEKIIKRRAKGTCRGVSEYLRDWITYEVLRDHHKKKRGLK